MYSLPERRATTIGPVAAEVLRHAHELDVIAVFERSLYLMAPNGIVALGIARLGAGPINILFDPGSGPLPWSGGLPAETKAITSPARLTIGRALTVDLASTPVWAPPPWTPWHGDSARTGLAHLRALAPKHVPHDGVSPLVFMPPHSTMSTPTAQAAAGQIAALTTFLPQTLRDNAWPDAAIRAAILLVGLGPGLTPSGDDLLGGLMLALSAIGQVRLRDTLWQAIGAELDDLTVPISAMHLSAAADGLGAATMHDMINALLASDADRIATGIPAIVDIGATSGWDALAGVVMGLEAAAL
jgi:Protein of unknown function (DUF2877)